MHLNHFVIDDFFEEPDPIREMALKMTYPDRDETEYYPGRNAAGQIQLPGIEKFIGGIVRTPLVQAASTSHAQPRLAVEGDDGKVSIHIDPVDWSALIYLTKPEHCQGGTHFYRQKKTGWDRAPVYPGEPEQLGYGSLKGAIDDILNTGGANDMDQWEESMVLPMRYNRIVIFRGYLYHDAGKSFGSSIDDGRLILPLFFKNPQSKTLLYTEE